MKIASNNSIYIIAIVSIVGLVNCGRFERPLRESDLKEHVIQKVVQVHNFSHIRGQDFNFNDLSPTMIHMSDGILYCSDGNRDRFLSAPKFCSAMLTKPLGEANNMRPSGSRLKAP